MPSLWCQPSWEVFISKDYKSVCKAKVPLTEKEVDLTESFGQVESVSSVFMVKNDVLALY